MERDFRRLSLLKLIKEAGILTDLVESSLGKSQSKSFKSLGSVGPGTTVMMPPNVVKPDGSVDVIIQIRGLAGGDTKGAAALGKNAVIVTAEAGGKGSKENMQAYGSPQFINQAVSKVVGFLQQQNPEKKIKLGKLTVSSFSGGGSATAALLMNRTSLPQGTEPPKFVFIDGLHSDIKGPVMKALVDFGKQSAQNKANGELEIVHTAVKPGDYVSTTETADYILNSLGLQRQQLTPTSELSPVSQATKGGVRITQLYDKEQPYMAKDNQGHLRPNVPGTSGYQHIQALNWGLKNII
jgi:hypothetical protein